MNNKDKTSVIFMAVIVALLSVWLALLVAPYIGDGLPGIIKGLPLAMEQPLHIVLCEDSGKSVLVFLGLDLLGLGLYTSSRGNYRHGEEHGSAKWGDAHTVNRKYCQQPSTANKILTRHVFLGLDGHIHRRNLNILVIGGSGAGKTRMFVLPNLLQANCSYVILDPKGEILYTTGAFLKEQGYEILVLDLIHMEKSSYYNPFVYLETENDVQRLVTNLFKATAPQGGKSNDPFWDGSASMLLSALIYFLLNFAPPEEQNFAMVMYLLRAADVDEENSSAMSPVDYLFAGVAEQQPDHICIKYYEAYKKGAGKTLKSIQITLAQRLEKFNLESLAHITSANEIDLQRLGEKKAALFALIPDNDSSFNFIVSVLYTQLFQQLFSLADSKYHGGLPVPVHIVMDEFANIAVPNDFEKVLATMRSRNISVSIILQNLAQLKALFEKSWEGIVGNCDSLLYLGGNEQGTHEYISKLLGKETISTNSFGRTRGRNGSYSTNTQLAGRELMTPDEVRMLDNQYALLFLRGEHAIMDLKYDPLKHPNAGKTPLNGGRPYLHGELTAAVASIELVENETAALPLDKAAANDYELLSREECENTYL